MQKIIWKISDTSEEEFQNFLIKNKTLKTRCDSLKIINIEDFKNKSQEYFDKFEKNKLRELIFKIYQEYSTRSDKESENFEKFFTPLSAKASVCVCKRSCDFSFELNWGMFSNFINLLIIYSWQNK